MAVASYYMITTFPKKIPGRNQVGKYAVGANKRETTAYAWVFIIVCFAFVSFLIGHFRKEIMNDTFFYVFQTGWWSLGAGLMLAWYCSFWIPKLSKDRRRLY